MIIYPTIELQNGKCVSLKRGDLDQPQIWHVDPIEKARSFAEAGASWMHVTDFDAVAGTGSNEDLVQQIIRSACIPVQVAGGIKTVEQVAHWVEVGAGRAVIGSAAVLTPQVVLESAKRFPDQVVLAVDAMGDAVMTDGWRSRSAFTPAAFLREFDSAPLAAIVFTDIDSDIVEGEASLARISAIGEGTKTPVIASGVVKTTDDISRLKYIPNISGAIVGRALFNRSVDLDEALAVAQPAPEPVAEFQ